MMVGVDHLMELGRVTDHTSCTFITLYRKENESNMTASQLVGLLLRGHVGHEVADTVAVGVLVVIP